MSASTASQATASLPHDSQSDDDCRAPPLLGQAGLGAGDPCALRANLTTSLAFRGFVLMTSFLALRASVCIFLWCLFNYFARFGLDGTATWMEQLPGLDTAARMEQLPGWNNYLGSNLRPQTTRALTLPIELRPTWSIYAA